MKLDNPNKPVVMKYPWYRVWRTYKSPAGLWRQDAWMGAGKASIERSEKWMCIRFLDEHCFMLFAKEDVIGGINRDRFGAFQTIAASLIVEPA